MAFHGHKNGPAELKVICETNGSTKYAFQLTKNGHVNAPERIRAAGTALDAKRIVQFHMSNIINIFVVRAHPVKRTVQMVSMSS